MLRFLKNLIRKLINVIFRLLGMTEIPSPEEIEQREYEAENQRRRDENNAQFRKRIKYLDTMISAAYSMAYNKIPDFGEITEFDQMYLKRLDRNQLFDLARTTPRKLKAYFDENESLYATFSYPRPKDARKAFSDNAKNIIKNATNGNSKRSAGGLTNKPASSSKIESITLEHLNELKEFVTESYNNSHGMR